MPGPLQKRTQDNIPTRNAGGLNVVLHPERLVSMREGGRASCLHPVGSALSSPIQ